jgi:hypothetical protein
MNSLVFGGVAGDRPAATVVSIISADAEASKTSELWSSTSGLSP